MESIPKLYRLTSVDGETLIEPGGGGSQCRQVEIIFFLISCDAQSPIQRWRFRKEFLDRFSAL